MSTETAAGRADPMVSPGRWTVDPTNSRVEFAIKHVGHGTIRGRFIEFDGTLEVAAALADSRARGKVIVSSIATTLEQCDADLRSPAFFDVEQYPEISFQSTRIEAIDEASARIFGELAMHGVTREVTFEVVVSGTYEDGWGNARVGLGAAWVIKRSDFDSEFNHALRSENTHVGDEVSISLDISAVKQA